MKKELGKLGLPVDVSQEVSISTHSGRFVDVHRSVFQLPANFRSLCFRWNRVESGVRLRPSVAQPRCRWREVRRRTQRRWSEARNRALAPVCVMTRRMWQPCDVHAPMWRVVWALSRAKARRTDTSPPSDPSISSRASGPSARHNVVKPHCLLFITPLPFQKNLNVWLRLISFRSR